MAKLIDLITYSKKCSEGHKFYTTKYFYSQPYVQYEGTPELNNPTPDDTYISKMTSNTWWNLKLGSLQYWEDSYGAKSFLPMDLKGGTKSIAWKWFLRENRHIELMLSTYNNPYTLVELTSRLKQLHLYIQKYLPKIYKKYYN